MSADPIAFLRVPPKLSYTASDVDAKAFSLYIEAEAGCDPSLMIAARITSAFRTVETSAQRKSNMGQGYLLRFVKKSQPGAFNDIMTIALVDARPFGREKLTVDHFKTGTYFTVPVRYTMPLPKLPLKLAPAEPDYPPELLERKSSGQKCSVFMKFFESSAVTALENWYKRDGPLGIVKVLEADFWKKKVVDAAPGEQKKDNLSEGKMKITETCPPGPSTAARNPVIPKPAMPTKENGPKETAPTEKAQPAEETVYYEDEDDMDDLFD